MKNCWTYMEEQALREKWDNHTIAELAMLLGRTAYAVAQKAHKLGLRKSHYGIVWTPGQLKLLRDHFPTMFNGPLAAWIGVSVRTLIRKARELGLEKKPGFLVERKDDIQRLASEALRRLPDNPGRFKKGIRHNPSGEFKPGHKESPETRVKRIAALKRSWKAKKARLELDKNLHPERYY